MQSAILAVLEEARALDVRRVSRTVLVKLVYLLDCLYAEGHGGQITSGSQWFFHHYGPFAVNLAGAIDELSGRGLLQASAGEAKGNDFTLFWLGEYPRGPSLQDIGLSPSLAGRFSSLIRKYAHDLSGLLDHAYFKTLPMLAAKPGRPLEFASLAEAATVKPHRYARVQDPGKMMQMIQLREKLTQGYKVSRASNEAMAAHRSIYDGLFARTMDALDAEDEVLAGPIRFEADLS